MNLLNSNTRETGGSALPRNLKVLGSVPVLAHSTLVCEVRTTYSLLGVKAN